MLPNEKITLRSAIGIHRTRIPGVKDCAAAGCCGFPVIVYDRDHAKAAELSA